MPSARTKRYRARVERRYGQRALNSKQESGQDGTPKPDPDGAFSDNAPIDDISFNMEAEESVDDVSHETSTFRESSASPSENTEYKGRKRTVVRINFSQFLELRRNSLELRRKGRTLTLISYSITGPITAGHRLNDAASNTRRGS